MTQLLPMLTFKADQTPIARGNRKVPMDGDIHTWQDAAVAAATRAGANCACVKVLGVVGQVLGHWNVTDGKVERQAIVHNVTTTSVTGDGFELPAHLDRKRNPKAPSTQPPVVVPAPKITAPAPTTPAKQASKTVSVGRKPGVVQGLADLLAKAKAPGMTVDQLVATLCADFGGEPGPRKNMVRTQLSWFPRTRNLVIVRTRVDGAMHYRSNGENA